MNAKGRLDPEELLADARGGRTESLGRVLELKSNLRPGQEAKVGAIELQYSAQRLCAPAAGVSQELFGIESALGVHQAPLYLQPHFRHEL